MSERALDQRRSLPNMRPSAAAIPGPQQTQLSALAAALNAAPAVQRLAAMTAAEPAGGVPINDEEHLEKEADLMGARAAAAPAQREALEDEELLQARMANPPPARGGEVVQRVLAFGVNTENYTISHAQYFRVQGTKFMAGNKDYKHVTADTVKDQIYNNIAGITLDELAQRVINVAAEYLNLPGLDLIETHRDYDDNDDDDENDVLGPVIDDPIGQNFAQFQTIIDQTTTAAAKVYEYKEIFDWAGEKQPRDAAAFHLQNQISRTIELLEKFRDLMPLVNVVSGLQKPGREKEANAFLREGKIGKNVKNENDALWAFFDFAAIDELAGAESMDKEMEIAQQLRDGLPWMNLDRARVVTGEIFNKQPGNVTAIEMANYIAALMVANHVKLVTMSYPVQAAACDFSDEANIKAALDKAHAPVDTAWVAKYARSRI